MVPNRKNISPEMQNKTSDPALAKTTEENLSTDPHRAAVGIWALCILPAADTHGHCVARALGCVPGHPAARWHGPRGCTTNIATALFFSCPALPKAQCWHTSSLGWAVSCCLPSSMCLISGGLSWKVHMTTNTAAILPLGLLKDWVIIFPTALDNDENKSN